MSAFVVHNLELDGLGGARTLPLSDLPKVLPEQGCRWVFWLFCIALVILGGGQFILMRRSRWF